MDGTIFSMGLTLRVKNIERARLVGKVNEFRMLLILQPRYLTIDS